MFCDFVVNFFQDETDNKKAPQNARLVQCGSPDMPKLQHFENDIEKLENNQCP
jgi:hypothetical protein